MHLHGLFESTVQKGSGKQGLSFNRLQTIFMNNFDPALPCFLGTSSSRDTSSSVPAIQILVSVSHRSIRGSTPPPGQYLRDKDDKANWNTFERKMRFFKVTRPASLQKPCNTVDARDCSTGWIEASQQKRQSC